MAMASEGDQVVGHGGGSLRVEQLAEVLTNPLPLPLCRLALAATCRLLRDYKAHVGDEWMQCGGWLALMRAVTSAAVAEQLQGMLLRLRRLDEVNLDLGFLPWAHSLESSSAVVLLSFWA